MGRREKKAAGKEAQGAVKCRTREKDRGKDRRRGRVAFVFRVRRSSLGRSVGRLVARAIRKGEVKGGRKGGVLKGCLQKNKVGRL